MERKAIYFNGDVDTGELKEFIKKIPDSGVTDIVIGGHFISGEGDLQETISVPVSLWVMGSINLGVSLGCNLSVKGDLHSTGAIDAWGIAVTGNFTCDGCIDITSAKVGGNLICQDNVDTNGKDILVSGDFICYGDMCNANVLYGGEIFFEGVFNGEVVKV